jgi:hypothetical protein
VLICVWVERSQPLSGTAAVEGAEPRRFDGWLELISVLSELVAAASSASEETKATEESIRGRRMGDDR